MDKKPAMGHNPLEYRPLAEAKFDFIPQTESGSEGEKSVEKKEETTPSKKVVSYYLDEELIEKIKRRAKEKADSYSHYVGQILKKAIDE